MRFDRRGWRILEGNNVLIESYFGSGAHHPDIRLVGFVPAPTEVLQEAIVLIVESRDRALPERVDVCGPFVGICILNEYYVGEAFKQKLNTRLVVVVVNTIQHAQ